jgi:hypothetical protein
MLASVSKNKEPATAFIRTQGVCLKLEHRTVFSGCGYQLRAQQLNRTNNHLGRAGIEEEDAWGGAFTNISTMH